MKNRELYKTVWRLVLWVNVAVILLFWWQGSSTLLFSDLAGGLIAGGRLAGLLAAGSVLLQFALMGRSPLLERVFGLDKLARIHSRSGKRAFYFLVAHPILLILGYSQLSQASLINQFLAFWFGYPYVAWAVIALFLFIIVIATSIVIVRNKLPYEAWYFVHLLVYIAVFLAFWHQINVGTDLLSSRIFYGYWVGLYSIVLGSQLIFRFIRPVYRLAKYQFRVEKVIRENYNVVSVYITGKNLEKFRIQPGQFMIFRFFTKTLWWQAHPFSLSKVPDGKSFRISVKELGWFTKHVGEIPIGTRVLIDGPYGIFTESVVTSPKLLFIAGGIGITPIRSLFEQMVAKNKDSVLLFANKSEEDIVFKRELKSVQGKYGGKVMHVIKDFLDAPKIKSFVPDAADREIFLCGPPPMMDAVIKALYSLGVPEQKIHFERFSLP